MIEKLINRFNKLEGERQYYESKWDEITEFVIPSRGFFNQKMAPGQTKNYRRFDSTAVQANEFLAALLHNGLTSSSRKWFILKVKNTKLNNKTAVRQFLDGTMDLMYDVLYRPTSQFHSQNHEVFLDLTAYGTACLYTDINADLEIRFKFIPLSEIYITENQSGVVDTVFRKFEYTARQTAQYFGTEKMSKEMLKLLEEDPDHKFNLLHVVTPNETYEPGKLSSSDLPFASYYICLDHHHELDKRGYNEMPYHVTRLSKRGAEVYGWSPAWSSLPDIRMLNVLRESYIKALQKNVDPPNLMADDGVMLPLNAQPGGVIFGGIDPVTGMRRVEPLLQNIRLNDALQGMQQTADAIRQAFFIDPLMNRDGPQMTATEVNTREAEKLQLLGPQVGRIQTEYLGPLIRRLYGLLMRAGLLPELDPTIAMELAEEGLEIEYSSDLAKTQRVGETIALQRTIQSLLPVIQANPGILDIIDGEEAFRSFSYIFGVNSNILKTQETLAEERKAKEQMMQQQMMEQRLHQGVDTLSKAAKSGLLNAEGNPDVNQLT